MMGATEVEDAVLSVVSFLIAMYVEGRMAKHSDITKTCWSLRGQIINLSLILGSNIDNSEINTVNKFRMYRYVAWDMRSLAMHGVASAADI